MERIREYRVGKPLLECHREDLLQAVRAVRIVYRMDKAPEEYPSDILVVAERKMICALEVLGVDEDMEIQPGVFLQNVKTIVGLCSYTKTMEIPRSKRSIDFSAGVYL